MASTMPMRPMTSSGSSTIASTHRRPSLTSFPSSSRRADVVLPQHSVGKIETQHARQQSSTTTSRSPQSQTSTASTRNAAISSNGGAQISQTQTRSQPQTKRVRSQYPADSGEKHVEYILVASFDIDRGSVMEHQYPGPVGGNEVMLAELMLPDQTHTRQQDWTIFFLHKDADTEVEIRRQKKVDRRRRRREAEARGGSVSDEERHTRAEDEIESAFSSDDEALGADDDSDDFEPVDIDGPPLVYVLNLVNTKQDNTVKRGAIVKAMAICTRHSFLHIYKPLLLLALEQYFAHPTIDTLATLYESVNNMDLSLMPKLNPYESSILQASSAKDLFIEKFEAMVAQRLAKTGAENRETSPTFTRAATATRYGLPRDTHEFESVVHYANVPVPVKIPTALAVETVGDFSLIKLITIFSTPHATAPVPFSPTHPHLTTSGPTTHPIIVLLNALLTQKRVIFLGHTLPSSEVAEAVLAACALASGGLLRGFTRYAFPYTDLTKIDDLLQVPGFIAGVTNPAFAHKNEWWDLLCDINTGRMKISTRIEAAPPTEGAALFHQQQQQQQQQQTYQQTGPHADATGDAAFMNSVQAAINDRHGENAVRVKFKLWIGKFTRLAAAFEDVVYGASALHAQEPSTAASAAASPNPPFASSFDTSSVHSSETRTNPLLTPGSMKGGHMDLPPEVLGHGFVWATQAQKNAELAAHATRIEGWRTTRSYYNFVQDLAGWFQMRAVRSIDLQHLHDKLAKLRLSPESSRNIYLAICGSVQSDAEINELLAIIANGMWDARVGPQGTGSGLFYLAYGLFHPKSEVREAVAELLSRIKTHEAGRHFWTALGRYIKTAWERIMKSKSAAVARLDESF